ncbi:MAG: TGS domain-containing protein [Tannerella sp.]|jgi:GTP pyrophosphokinase|nr:TGS domain-containing protein [Tannerella sp.]
MDTEDIQTTKKFFTDEEKQLFFRKYRELLKALSESLEKDDIPKIRQLLRPVVAMECYGRDRNGINGMLRNIETALIATLDIGLKRTSVLALILYRPVLKKAITIEEVERAFNTDVSLIINRLLKTSDLYARNTAVNSENFHHLLFSFAEDVRVILIMIADRLCMMRLGKELAEEKDRIRLATEVSYLYAPLAHRLGLYKIKSEFEDLSLKYLDSKQYYYIKDKLNETKRSRDEYIANFIDPVKKKLEAAGLKFDIKGRTKSIHSINTKMKKQKVDFEGIYDLFAIRIVLDSEAEKERSDCWQAFSIITDMYQPNPNRMRDWISVPKSNGYESLHITVLGPQKRWVEVQIRTQRMDEIAEKGLAAHWKYKGGQSEKGLDEFLSDVRAVLETQGSTPMDLMKEFKMDLYQDEIYVFTPSGDLIKLGKGATVLDFAFAIHSKLGSRCVSGRVNNRNVPIKHVLNNGDTIEIVTSPTQSPKRDWLSFVATSKARSKIKQALREEYAKNAELAKEQLQRRIKNRKVDIEEAALMRYIKKKGYKTVTDFYVAISEGHLDINTVIDECIEMERRDLHETTETRSAEEFVANLEAKEMATGQDVLVIDKNLTGIDYKLAKCCNPIYGDPVFGFISTQGIKIHRMDCPNAAEMRSRFGYRILPAEWSGKGASGYGVTLRIIGNDDIGIVTNITSVISKESRVLLRSINIDSVDGLFQGTFAINIPDTSTLTVLTKKLQGVKGVKSINRVN